MATVAIDSKQLVKEYFTALSGQPKPEELLNRFTSDEALKEHILGAEAAFPCYEVVPLQIVAEGELVSARCIFRGVHKGPFVGVEPTGRHVSQEFMIFYRVVDGRITEHWMQLNFGAVLEQLTK